MILNESLFEEYNDTNGQLHREITSQTRKEVVAKPISVNVKNIILQNKDLINNNLKEFINYCLITLDANEIIELLNILLDAEVGVDIDMVAGVKNYKKLD